MANFPKFIYVKRESADRDGKETFLAAVKDASDLFERGEPTTIGPTHGCGQAGHPWASESTWDLSPSLAAAGIAPPAFTLFDFQLFF